MNVCLNSAVKLLLTSYVCLKLTYSVVGHLVTLKLF